MLQASGLCTLLDGHDIARFCIEMPGEVFAVCLLGREGSPVLYHLRTGCILACALRPQHHLKEARVKDLVEWMNSHGGGREGR